MRSMAGLMVGALLLMLGAAPVLAEAVPVRVEKKEGIGSYLTDDTGMTLYYFAKDSPGKSACSGDCLTRWPIYFKESIAPPMELKGDDFGVLVRDDGKKQSTYKGRPLYYFFKDKNAGDTLGQGVNKVWYIVEP